MGTSRGAVRVGPESPAMKHRHTMIRIREPNTQQGANPFMPVPPRVYRPDGPQPVFEQQSAGGSAAAKPYSGDLAGLYSAPRDQPLTDRDELIEFYAAHPAEASSAAQAFGSDGTFTWSRGKQIDGPGLVAYLRELTPVLLRIDLRVTNYTLVDGRAAGRQSILQAGTAVLVDSHGVPRFRSLSGSPLTLAAALPHSPTFTNTPWSGFDPKLVGAVSPGISLTVITLIDTGTGNPFDRPVGTTGAGDADHPEWPTPGAATTTPTTVAPSTPRATTRAAPAGPLDLSGVWVMNSNSNVSDVYSMTGTMTQTTAGFVFHYEDAEQYVSTATDCTLPNSLGTSVSLDCRITVRGSGEAMSSTYRCEGPVVAIPWGDRTKFRFDGSCETITVSGPPFTVTIMPQ